MPLGIISDEEFSNELINIDSASIKKSDSQVKDIKSPGRKPGDNNVPQGLRNLIAQETIEGNRKSAIELAKKFDISSQSVDAYSNGANSLSNYHTPNLAIIEKLNDSRRKIAVKASDRLEEALQSLTSEKISASKARDISGIAKDLSSVMRNMEPAENNDKGDGVKFVVFAPQIKQDESSFKVKEVNE